MIQGINLEYLDFRNLMEDGKLTITNDDDEFYLGGKPRSPKWRLLKEKMVMAHPYCSVCHKRKELTAHHKKPFHLFPELELNPSNLVVLCEGESVNCHLLFGHLMNWCCYNEKVDEDIRNWEEKIKNRNIKSSIQVTHEICLDCEKHFEKHGFRACSYHH